MMEYPIFDVPRLVGSLLIAGIALVHVFISHFSVGAGSLVAFAERRGNSGVTLSADHPHS